MIPVVWFFYCWRSNIFLKKLSQCSEISQWSTSVQIYFHPLYWTFSVSFNLKTHVCQEIWRIIWKLIFLPSIFLILSFWDLYLLFGCWTSWTGHSYGQELFHIHIFISQSPRYLILSSCSANDGWIRLNWRSSY